MSLFTFIGIRDGCFHAYIDRPRSGGDSTTRMATMWAIQTFAPLEGWDGVSVVLTYSDGSTVSYLQDFIVGD